MMKMIGAHSVPVRAPFQPSHLEILNLLAVHHPALLRPPQVEDLQQVVVKDLLPEAGGHPQAVPHQVHREQPPLGAHLAHLANLNLR